jgi:hypothetical protein
MTGSKRRHTVPDRARRRAIRALAAQLGVAYSVAARRLAAEKVREIRPFHARVRDTREAADLPLGRATHLTARFAGPLSAGPSRRTVLAMLYATVAHESAELMPAAEELAWVAELGEEAAVDITCAGVDRAARHLLDEDGWRLWTRVEAALTAGEAAADRPARDAAVTLGRELRTVSLRGSVDGARETLDQVLLSENESEPVPS